MKTTIKQYNACLSEVENYSDKDAFVSDLALSDILENEETADIPSERIEWLGELWEAYNRSIKDIAKAANLSQRKLAERFGIPYRTVSDWATGKRSCNVYLRLMMQECLGLLKVEIE